MKQMNYYHPEDDRQPTLLQRVLPWLLLATALIASFVAFVNSYRI